MWISVFMGCGSVVSVVFSSGGGGFGGWVWSLSCGSVCAVEGCVVGRDILLVKDRMVGGSVGSGFGGRPGLRVVAGIACGGVVLLFVRWICEVW